MSSRGVFGGWPGGKVLQFINSINILRKMGCNLASGTQNAPYTCLTRYG
jgi:hypothetical protein